MRVLLLLAHLHDTRRTAADAVALYGQGGRDVEPRRYSIYAVEVESRPCRSARDHFGRIFRRLSRRPICRGLVSVTNTQHESAAARSHQGCLRSKRRMTTS